MHRSKSERSEDVYPRRPMPMGLAATAPGTQPTKSISRGRPRSDALAGTARAARTARDLCGMTERWWSTAMASGGQAGFTSFGHACASRMNDVLRFASDLLRWPHCFL